MSTKLKKPERLQRIIELRAKGWTYQRIAAELGVSRNTILRDRADTSFQDFVDEIVRQQLFALCQPDLKPKDQAYFRDKLLDKLMPRRIETTGESNIHVSFTWDEET